MKAKALTGFLDGNYKNVVFCCILAFFYLYPLKFVFFPYLNTRYLLGCAGILFLCRHKENLMMSSDAKKSIGCLFLFSFIVCLSCSINLTTDLSLFSIPLTFLFNYLAFWGCFSLQGKPNAERFSFYLIIACVIQMAISLFFYLNPDVESVIGSLIYTNKLGQKALEETSGIRLQGLGSNFFSAGVDNSIILILISIFVNHRKKLYITCFIIVTIIGTCMARTTLVGFALALPVLIINVSKRSLFQSISILTTIVLMVIAVINFAKNHEDIEIRKLYYFGAELLDQYDKTGSFSTKSSSEFFSVSDMLNSMSLRTLIIGDGLFADPRDPEMAYYMHVDQGYLRIIYYTGIIGLIVKIMAYFYLSRDNVKKMRDKRFYIFLFAYIVMLYKGELNIFYLLIPYSYLKIK